ncbi:copper amine oxidase N-terminal domain-containing protein [Paenibacillus hunanensis]|uniref:copper amine oxidase N-terminal domain-containing protein n=1 Tax=Paenibacillus hunanensis TaxID=539262 RepID=UPI002A6A51CD|nr:copper amine oxidase N-terminal domain-containing protein [Paenibacillus hunanensis]WPP41173.1 copper amine oxidase N-terminal domain-containing protein [Paenibacillus hunanensis]
MKKFVLASLVFILALSISNGFYLNRVVAAPLYRLYVNLVQIDASSASFAQNGTILVPMKSVFTALGYTISIQSNTWSMSNDEGHSMVLNMNSKHAKVNGKPQTLSIAPQIINGTAYISLTSLSKMTGEAYGVDNLRSAAWIGEKPILNPWENLWGAPSDYMKSVNHHGTFIKKISENNMTALQYREENEGVTSDVYLIFYNDKLVQITMNMHLSDFAANAEGTAAVLHIYTKVKNGLNKVYGAASNDQSFTTPSTPKQWMQLANDMQYKPFRFQTEWTEGRTTALSQFSSDGSNHIARITVRDMSADQDVLDTADHMF